MCRNGDVSRLGEIGRGGGVHLNIAVFPGSVELLDDTAVGGVVFVELSVGGAHGGQLRLELAGAVLEGLVALLQGHVLADDSVVFVKQLEIGVYPAVGLFENGR